MNEFVTFVTICVHVRRFVFVLHFDYLNTNLPKYIQRFSYSVFAFVIHTFHVAEIDQHFCAHDAWTVGNKDELVYISWRITINDAILFRMQIACTCTRSIRIAGMWQSCCGSVITYCKNLAKICCCHNSSYLQSFAC